MEKLERDKKFCTVSIGDEKINYKDDDGDNPTALSSDNKERGDPEVWGSEARVVDDYKGRTPVVDGLICTIVEYCGYRDEKNSTRNNRTRSFSSLSTVRA